MAQSSRVVIRHVIQESASYGWSSVLSKAWPAIKDHSAQADLLVTYSGRTSVH